MVSQREHQDDKSAGTASKHGCPDPGEKYARRQRSKTKNDRYELKETKSKRPTRTSKINSRQRSSAVLKEVFHAPNVHTERLTLKPNLGPGIFGKGKASVPVEWEGLPGLTFSEMNFLSRKGKHSDRRFTMHHDSNLLKRAKETPSEDISRFFTRPRDDAASPKPKKLQTYRLATTLAPTCDTRDNFGHTQTTERYARNDGPFEESYIRSRASYRTPSSNAISWSDSLPHHNHCPEGEQPRRSSIPPDTSIVPWVQDCGSRGGEPRTTTIHPMSSASNRLFKQHTDHVLMSDIKKWSQQNTQYLSLEDLKRLAKRAGEHESALGRDEVHVSEDRVQPLEAFLEAADHSSQSHKSTKKVVNLRIQLPENSTSRRVRAQGRGGAEHNEAMGLRRRSDDPSIPQSAPFHPSLQDSVGCHFEDRLSENATVQLVPTDAQISAQSLLVSSDQTAPKVNSICQLLHTPEHAEFAQRGHFMICQDNATSPFAPENDTDSLDQFDIQLLGIDHSGSVDSARMMNGNESADQEPNTVKDFRSIHGLSANPKASDTANTDDTLGGPKVYNHHLEKHFVMHGLSPRPIPHPLGNTLGLISHRLEEPAEEVFTGFSRPHILY